MKTYLALPPILLGLCWLISTSVARANGDDRSAYADDLFQEGVALMKKNDCAAAVPKFLSSNRLDPAAASLVNVATCYSKSGRTGSAYRTYLKAAALAEAEHDAALKAQTLQAIAALEPILTKLRLVTTSKAPQLSLTLNGEPISTQGSAPIPLDPGENVIEAFAPGHESWQRTVSAREPGMLLVVDVPELSPVKAPDNDAHWRTTAIVVGSVGVAGIATGLGFGLSAKSAYDESEAHCDANYCSSLGQNLRETAINRATVSTVAVGLGALATAAGVGLWFAFPGPSSLPVRFMPLVQPQAVGLGIEGSL
jgi:tetratricopeptide (TPR) repeat protein